MLYFSDKCQDYLMELKQMQITKEEFHDFLERMKNAGISIEERKSVNSSKFYINNDLIIEYKNNEYYCQIDF